MRLRNKKTGEIVESILEAVNRLDNGKDTWTLAELNAEWDECNPADEKNRIGSIELLRKKHNMDNGTRIKVKIIKEEDEGKTEP